MTRFVEGNAVRLLQNGQQYFPALETAINDARREIFLQTYIFNDDHTARAIAAALCRAAQRGVVVRVAVDGFGGRDFVTHTMPKMLACGVQVLIFRREWRKLALNRCVFRSFVTGQSSST